ncbi:hypothetical protein H6P81_021241 [Aristolochia fimbriata]|uniref:Uncharacterized protein n=1 Tax=Aristolochia fimbriata TaxID=158543 RepID=A0AAV7DTH6_ARIFI|nr:hypothetical protein H6P81_021241 [Aristolochia fimbriata]
MSDLGAHRPVEGASRPVHTPGRTDRPTQGPTSELFNCNNLNIRYWAGITAAAGTGLALNGSSLKGFRLYSFQLPGLESPVLLFIVPTSRVGDWDQPGSILERPAAPQHSARSRVRLNTGRGASAVEQKLKAIRLRLRINQVHRGLPHSHGSMNTFVVRRSSTPAAPDCARPYPPRPRVRRRVSKGLYIKASCPFRGKNTKHQGNASDPTRPAGGPCGEGKTARRGGGSSDGKHHFQRMSSVHHFAAAPSVRRPMPGPCMASQQKSHKARLSKRIKIGRGAPSGPARGVKDQKKTSSWAKGSASPLGPFPACEKELKAIMQRGEGQMAFAALTLRGKPLPEALGATSPT